MSIKVRKATAQDMKHVHALIHELAVFEKEPDAVEISLQDLIKDGFGKEPAFVCFVAEFNNVIAGMALLYPRYSTWKGKTIHLEDLIVSEAFRGKGVGNALFAKVIKHGHELGVKRIEWAVLDWNETAIVFYENHGAKVLRDWDVVQMNEQGIQNFIARLQE
jgi:GNAT superfamily N-acetyltransferase